MSVMIAEYLGQRTDALKPDITPVPAGTHPPCPFMASHCVKLTKSNKPICSVRKPDGKLWIVCADRLCSTKKNLVITQYQINILRQIAHTIFTPTISDVDVLFKREVPIKAGNSDYNADYIMINNSLTPSNGPDRVVLEMQGGGETSNTGAITKHVTKWEALSKKTNNFLKELIPNVGTIETNAWRRQQEQFIVKGRSAMLTRKGTGMVFCMGPCLYDYLYEKVKDAGLRTNLKDHNWTLALLCLDEPRNIRPKSGPIPLCIDTSRMLFTDYQAFVRALTDQGGPSPNTFKGAFSSLLGTTFNVP